MEWPFRRFLKAFDAYQRRTLVDEWKARRAAHIAALFSNPNLDDEKNDRASIVARLEETYEDVIAKIWNGGPSEEEQQAEEAVMSSPFMRASKAATTRMEEQAKQLRMVKSAAAQIKQPRPFTMPGESAIGALPA